MISVTAHNRLPLHSKGLEVLELVEITIRISADRTHAHREMSWDAALARLIPPAHFLFCKLRSVQGRVTVRKCTVCEEAPQ
jgi:hypothetical protein